MLFAVSETPVLKATGKGVMGIKLRDDDEVMAFELARSTMQGPAVVTNGGRDLVVRERKFGLSKRGGRGKVVLQRGTIDVWHRAPAIALGSKDDTSVAPEHDEDEGE